jgi:hypothetical protein
VTNQPCGRINEIEEIGDTEVIVAAPELFSQGEKALSS